MVDFVHLHTHSEYSLLDGLIRIKGMVKRVKEMGMSAVALTDHGVMCGTIEFYKEATAAGIKPIVGVEIYVAKRSLYDKTPEDSSSYHLVLLAKNALGYKNLCKLASIASLEGFYYNPRIDRELLRKYSEGLIGLSGCLKGEVQSFLLKGEYERAKEIALDYKSIFAPGDFYIELMDHGIMEQKKILPMQVQLAGETDIKLVATNDAHYIKQKDSIAHDVLLCIQTGKTLDDPNRMRYSKDQFYLKSQEEMKMIFPDYPSAITNTVEVAEKCNLQLDLNRNILPDFDVPEGFTKESYLEHICREGTNERYGGMTPELEERLKTELEVINGRGLAAYFLIVWDFIKYAKKHKIPVGPGRGSAAGSLLAYTMGITDVDPIKYGLIFERFLNPERKSLPDIDIDFCKARREEVIKYVTNKYGSENVSQIITFGRMKSRAAIRDVGRVYGINLGFVDKLAKMVPLGADLQSALETPELKAIYQDEANAKKILDMAIELEGIARNASIHASGVLISKDPITDCAPLYKMKGDEVVVQYDMNYSADVGLLKMDFLGLRNLTTIEDALKMIKKNYGVELDLSKIPLEDAATFQILQQGKTAGVFQLESAGMTRYLVQLKPGSVEDIIAMCALYRPGPLKGGMVEEFIKRKHGITKTKYLHPILEPILKETYGVIIYQEQVMKIANEVGGYSMGEADQLRRAMGKKKPELMAKQRSVFLERAVKKGYDKNLASEIFNYMEKFASYGFNKSHTACYGVIAYQTAYLKTHYPKEYMAAVLTSNMESTEKVSFFIKECKNMGIPVLPPDVNESNAKFTVTKKGVRFGLAAIKNVGIGPIESIIKVREQEGPFTDLHDFCCRVEGANRKVIESLILSGAMDSFNETRATLLHNLDGCMEFGHCRRKEKLTGQISFFHDMFDQNSVTPALKKMPELEMRTLLSKEKELLGIYVTSHPLDACKEILGNESIIPVSNLSKFEGGQKITIAGIINSVKKKVTKNNKLMAFLEIEDLSGGIEVTVFPRTFEECQSLIVTDGIVLITGKLELEEPFIKDDDEATEIELVPKIMANKISELKRSNLPKRKPKLRVVEERKTEKRMRGIHIKLENDGFDFSKLKQIIKNAPGEEPVYFHCETGSKTTILQVDSRYYVHSLERVKGDVEGLLGGGTTWTAT
ncbi:MAG: DNA polymerase III subunit alpha [Candidatus Eremiobacteraeota bacterium]|nr:DNA polymerase III subunit alpha [Candidatus Eremiobacteraeota bacterium]